MLALEKSVSDRMQAEVRLAPAAALVSWRLDQSVRDTTARRQMDAIRRLSQPTTDSPFEALLRMVRGLAWCSSAHARTHAHARLSVGSWLLSSVGVVCGYTAQAGSH